VQGLGFRGQSKGFKLKRARCIGFEIYGTGGNNGRGQPLSFAPSFGEISWFDVQEKIQHCDWLIHIFKPGNSCWAHILDQSQCFISPVHQTTELRQTTVRATVADPSHKKVKCALVRG